MSTTKNLSLSFNLEGDHDFLIQRRDLSDYNLYIKHQDKLGFNNCKNVLSIGCGDGYIDSFLASTCMPSLKNYCGIYPVAGHCQAFLQRMKDQVPHANVSVVCGDPLNIFCNNNEIKRPDLIIIWHFLYHITNVEDLFATYLRQLQDSGSIVVTLAKPNCFWSQISDEVNESPTYDSNTFLRDLLRMGVKRKDIKYTLSVSEYYDASNPTQETYNSILEREASEIDKEIINKVFEKNAKEGILTQNVVTFFLPKYIFPKSFFARH